MKTEMRISSVLRTFMILAAAVVLAAAVIQIAETDEVFADEGYKYSVTIYTGKCGTLADGSTVWRKEYEPNELVEITPDSIGLKVTNDNYYTRGFVISGHDNDELENPTTGSIRMTFRATKDLYYNVSYGIKGALVKYVAKYVDGHGKEIADSDTYYGMAGDKPVISFKYISGWMPDSYNKAKTLSDNEDENVFEFVYTKESEESGEGNEEENGEGNNGNPGDGTNGANGANGQPAAPLAPGTTQNPTGTGVNDDDGDTGTTIDDDPTPTAPGEGGNQQYTDLDPGKTPLAVFFHDGYVLMGSLFALSFLIILLIIFLIRKKRKTEEEPE